MKRIALLLTLAACGGTIDPTPPDATPPPDAGSASPEASSSPEASPEAAPSSPEASTPEAGASTPEAAPPPDVFVVWPTCRWTYADPARCGDPTPFAYDCGTPPDYGNADPSWPGTYCFWESPTAPGVVPVACCAVCDMNRGCPCDPSKPHCGVPQDAGDQ